MLYLSFLLPLALVNAIDTTSSSASSSSADVSSASSDASSSSPSPTVDVQDLQQQLEGTWSSKSNQVFTGPGFFDPIDELLIEPSLPGISYSFTSDGFWEQATYQVSGNPKNPKCPAAALVWQHGKYDILDNGTMILTPFKEDGRMLVSDPCTDNGTSTYMRYNSSITFQAVTVSLDDYHGMYKLQIYQFDGSPMQPLYLAYRPPMMLPTQAINSASSSNSTSKRSLRDLVKRNLQNKYKTNASKTSSFVDSNIFWYISTGMLCLGSIIFLLS
ncbi:hypothetical protein TBLA_0A02400 [Henningerozyma blattae CBS 6284]|uniref:Protein ROT1 n=1 Tax=Henningerozyma blattae (strain ATCC 34711 / CBS 6284 / DSM 70876 / NBRC 10599 / NRRL Y-10934 / UCD 77-7) TaxID=1071380 RepID=I2GV87_HENB6|nr:hypothetical protein TBLA_0A02400 [Tetrapisispora blattae CBS 6284]CCH58039.1 hypothetical protein TBLA_0A02400 [Tetrapisispora blattae CBS 6284]